MPDRGASQLGDAGASGVKSAAPPAADASASERVEVLLRSRPYIVLLITAAILGVPVSALAFGFLKLTTSIVTWVYTDMPHGLGFSSTPTWWPLLPLTLAGLVVGATVRYLPGAGGEVPADGFKAGAAPVPDAATELKDGISSGLSLGIPSVCAQF